MRGGALPVNRNLHRQAGPHGPVAHCFRKGRRGARDPDGGDDASRGAAEELTALRAIAEGTARATGEGFLQSLVRCLARAVEAHYAFVAEFASPETTTRARTIAFWSRDRIAENIEWTLAGTPCEEVVHGKLCHHPSGVRQSFPNDRLLVERGIESYLGVPLCDPEGKVLGHLAVFDERPMPEEPRKLLAFRIFAARAAAELAAPASRTAASRKRGAPAGPVRGGPDCVRQGRPPIAVYQRQPRRPANSGDQAGRGGRTGGAVARSRQARRPAPAPRSTFALQVRGTETRGVVVELRRKDDGKPVWIQIWAKPEPGGKYTRTMFLDVTDRVLMEQEKARLAAENIYLQEEIKSVHNFEEIVGQSPALLDALEKVNRVARTDATVLITGETGTGKELIARAIHSASQRRDKPLIKVNCAALPAGLVESELFGHEKGAFSGAISRRVGRFELANGGTIFLDEIGEVPLRRSGQAPPRAPGTRVRARRRDAVPSRSMSASLRRRTAIS